MFIYFLIYFRLPILSAEDWLVCDYCLTFFFIIIFTSVGKRDAKSKLAIRTIWKDRIYCHRLCLPMLKKSRWLLLIWEFLWRSPVARSSLINTSSWRRTRTPRIRRRVDLRKTMARRRKRRKAKQISKVNDWYKLLLRFFFRMYTWKDKYPIV